MGVLHMPTAGLGTIRSSLARGMWHRHMIILKSVTTYIYYDN